MAHRAPSATVGPDRATAFLDGLSRFKVGPLWKVLGQILTPEPQTRAVPHLWSWQELRPQFLRSGEVVTAAEAERRVLMLLNPGLKGRVATTTTLYGGLQLILPGEIARTHRHTPDALYFIMEGEGAYTVVDGDKMTMAPGDFVLTPNWTWHDHGSEGDHPVVWLDGLDIPLVSLLENIFTQAFPQEAQPVTKPLNTSVAIYGRGGLLPSWQRAVNKGRSGLLKYAWTDAYDTLMSLGKDEESPFDGSLLEYVNPLNGGPSLSTMASFLQHLRPSQNTRTHRHSTSTVYLAVQGHGRTLIDGRACDWAPGDVFALPLWAAHSHQNRSASHDALLFSFSDAPVMCALGWYREQEL